MLRNYPIVKKLIALRVELWAFTVILVSALLINSCSVPQDISTQNLASLYKSPEIFLHPDFVVFNMEDSLSRLYVRVLKDEFLFVRQPDDHFRANLKIQLDILSSYESAKILDSLSAEFSLDLDDKIKTSSFFIEFSVKEKGEKLMRITLKDNNRNYEETFYVNYDNQSFQSRQNFLLTDLKGEPLFRNFVEANEKIKIKPGNRSHSKLWCKYYHRDFLLAAPPFTFDIHNDFNYHPDSIFSVELASDSGILLPNEGFYHFQTDTAMKEGLTIFRYSSGFPQVTTPGELLEPLRYLTTKKEFDDMKSKPNPRQASDNWWLERGGNQEKTRQMIRKYYTRVKDANRLFSDHTEGWRTDRGMMYIIFGPPSTLYRGAVSESWIYGTPNNALSLNFFFTKVNNPFSDNDFTLSRAPVYEASWYSAVEAWRQGRTYNSMY